MWFCKSLIRTTKSSAQSNGGECIKKISGSKFILKIIEILIIVHGRLKYKIRMFCTFFLFLFYAVINFVLINLGSVWDYGCWLNKLLLLCRYNKQLIKKVAWYLVNYVVAVVISLKSSVYAFSKFYYKLVILSYND